MRSSALQPWKWQLTGIGCSTAAQSSGAHCPRNGLWTRSYAARRITPQSVTLDLHPVIHVPNYMDYYSFTDPWGMDGWVGHVGWPIADGVTTKWSLIQLAVWRRIGKVRRPRPAFLPLCYAARHQVSFTTGQLLCLLHSSTFAADLQRPVMKCDILVPASLKCNNQPRSEVRALGRQHARSSEFRTFTTKQLHCLTRATSRSTVLCWKM